MWEVFGKNTIISPQNLASLQIQMSDNHNIIFQIKLYRVFGIQKLKKHAVHIHVSKCTRRTSNYKRNDNQFYNNTSLHHKTWKIWIYEIRFKTNIRFSTRETHTAYIGKQRIFIFTLLNRVHTVNEFGLKKSFCWGPYLRGWLFLGMRGI
jgi:hypothetical protein